MGFGLVHFSCDRARAKHTEDAEDEVAGMTRIKSCQLPQRQIAAVPVTGVGAPAPQDPLSSVGLAHVQLAVGGVSDQVDALHRTQCDLPRVVARVRHDVEQLAVGNQQSVEAGEGNGIRIGDLNEGERGGARAALRPVDRVLRPVDDESIPQRCQQLGLVEVEEARIDGPLAKNLAAILVGAGEAGTAGAIRHEDQPNAGRLLGNLRSPQILVARVCQEIRRGRVSGRSDALQGLVGVPDGQNVVRVCDACCEEDVPQIQVAAVSCHGSPRAAREHGRSRAGWAGPPSPRQPAR